MVTKSELLGALNCYLRAYEGMGVTLNIKFQEGSSTQGVAYRVEMVDGSDAPGLSHNGFCGHTRGEAWHTLLTAARALEDLSRLQKQQQPTEVTYFRNNDGSVVGFEV